MARIKLTCWYKETKLCSIVNGIMRLHKYWHKQFRSPFFSSFLSSFFDSPFPLFLFFSFFSSSFRVTLLPVNYLFSTFFFLLFVELFAFYFVFVVTVFFSSPFARKRSSCRKVADEKKSENENEIKKSLQKFCFWIDKYLSNPVNVARLQLQEVNLKLICIKHKIPYVNVMHEANE